MKIIKPNVTEVTDFEGVDNFYKAAARTARICYASDKTDNDKELCERLIKLKHFSPFEHAILYIPIYGEFRKWAIENKESKEWKIIDTAKFSKYIISDWNKDDNCELAINGRLLVESTIKHSDNIIQALDNVLKIIKMFELNNHWFKSFIVDTSIGCTREMNRHHDNFYICEQSTRFCNFSKDKFGNEVAFNEPYWYDTKNDAYKKWWKGIMEIAERFYMTALRDIPDDLKNCSDDEFGMGLSTDEARGILPLDTHTRAIYTATIEEWNHFIDLRLKGVTGKPHGDIKIIAEKINKFINDEKKI